MNNRTAGLTEKHRAEYDHRNMTIEINQKSKQEIAEQRTTYEWW